MARRFKVIAIGLLGLGLVTGLYLFSSLTAFSASDGVELQIRVEVSTDNGKTWVNTAGTEHSGGQVAHLCEGDGYKIRTRIWNTGNVPAYQVTGLSNTAYTNNQNGSYQNKSLTVDTADEDGDGTSFLRRPFTENGSIYIATVAANTSYNNGYEGSVVTVQPPSVCPTPGTEITLTANIQGYALYPNGVNQVGGKMGWNNLFGRANAASVGNNSQVTIVPCDCETGTGSATPESGTAGDGASSTSLSRLPETGADL